MAESHRSQCLSFLLKKKKTKGKAYMPIYLVPYAAEAEGKEKAEQSTKNDMGSLCVWRLSDTWETSRHVGIHVSLCV